MNFRFVIIINLFLLIGLTFPAYAKNIPPKLKPEKFIDKSVSSSKTSKLFDNITKNKKKDQVAITPKNDLPKEEELNQKKEIKKDIKEPKQKQTAEKEIVKSKETKEIKKNDEAKEIVPKIKPQDFKSFSPEHKGPLETKTLNNRDFEISKVVFDYVDRKQWKLALSDAQKMQDKTIYNLVNWMYLIDPQSGASFNEYFIFIKNNKDWPRINRIKYLAEHKINFDNNSPSSIIEYFNNNPPLSGFGRLRLAEAFLENNQSEKAKNLVKDGFKDAELSKNDLRYFSKIFKKFLTQQDYVLRADYFAYEAKYQDLRDTIEYLNADYQKLYNARAALFTKRSADNLIAQVPQYLKEDPGLIYDRIKWRRKKSRFDEALTLINLSASDSLERNQYLAKERLSIARDKIQDKEFKTAYEILKDHSSKARAAFWIGKTYKKLGQTNQANTWFKTGSQYGTTFYGQLSHKEIDEKKFLINNSFKFSEEKYEEFKKNNPLAKSVVILKELNRTKYTKDILRHLGDVDQNKTAEEISMAGVLAQEIERYDFAIQIAKNASYKNLNFLEISYPRIEVPQQIKNQKILDSSVILALIRQESEFDTSATSRVGAKGLMQIMPATARLLSKVTNIDFSREKLTKDKDYNLALGSYYISDLDDLFGSHYLAFAAYNAGPNRVEKWIKTFGDPRRKQIDAIDFIELIPFHETRNYVQRVSENINVYEYLKDPNN
ncbi:MAG: lytic transglycosylase domain-containing protein, partial [Candidatus Fonsibacter ubiquis]|nr:lytic transglycosylase domain-containing protein [Candidatus Fonsibacter ubiquis]